MVANWLKILLFAAGGTTAATGTAYYTGLYDPWATQERSVPMAASQPESPPEPAPAPEPEAASAPAVQAPPAPQAAEAPAEDVDAPSEREVIAALPEPEAPDVTDLAVPSFDLVRVEPDGSMVIAGSAEPNSEIEVVAGANVIARADVGPAGDFAAVLDDALQPGDYQIVLRSTGPGAGNVTTSLETAIVSVPEDETGQVLALVEEPGAPSKLITVPVAEGAETEEAPAPELPAGAPAQQQAALADEPAPVPGPTARPGPAPSQDVPVDEPMADEATGTDVEDPAAVPTPDIAASAPAQPAPPPAGEDVNTAGSQTQIAARPDPQPLPQADTRPTTPRNALAVEAIEIEGGTVFVAGRGMPGSTVRVYANEILLGEALVSEAGRFLIETQTDLPVGDYIVRADVLGSGGEVTARAAVPFQREPGEAIAAVAPPEPTRAAASPRVAVETEPATPPVDDSAIVEDEAIADAPAVTEDADAAPSVGRSERVGVAEPAIADEIAPASEPQAPATEPQATATPQIATKPSPTMPQAAAIDATMAAPLQAADGAVIIRRGDTLWRISRRVYGRGVRYSTIYLANQEQIRDPDMIWPGQVFAVPDKTQEGETADMSTVSDQIAPPTETE